MNGCPNQLYWRLPKEARNLIDCLGFDMALKIIEVYGGTRLSIPAGKKQSKNRTLLIDLLGEAGFSKLAGTFGSGVVPIPICMELKRRKALALHLQGWSADRIAKELGHDYSTIYRWIWSSDEQKPPQSSEDVQSSLFGEGFEP